MSSSQALAQKQVSTQQQSNDYSLYIPTIHKKYSAEMLINIFWQFFMGNVDRIDFVPIMKQPKDPKKEPFEDANFWQAFIYVRPRTAWGSFVTDAIEKDGSYRFYPNPDKQGSPKEFWLILKNKSPVPYAQTHLNVHQLAHNNSLLETKVSEMEAKASEMEAKAFEMELEIATLKARMEYMVQNVARLQYDNETMSMQLTGTTGRERCDSHSTTESDAESFVNSWENILQMMEEGHCIVRHDENEYDDNDGREREEDLVYDDSGEMTPRGRIIKKDANGNTYYQYEMLEVSGYNNGDVAPRGEKVTIEVIDLEVCSECGFKGELMAYGWRHADDNLCKDCVNLPGMDKYEC